MEKERKESCPAWELTGKLVGIDSSDPGAYEGNIEGWIREWLRAQVEEAGLLCVQDVTEAAGWNEPGAVLLLEEEVMPGRKNLMARIGAENPGPSMTCICHMDTVMLGEGWDKETPPLGAVIKEGRMYGRGACDMKSGLACALSAFKAVLERSAMEGRPPKRPITFIGTVDEEDFMRGVEAAIRSGWVKKEDWLLDTEPTDGQIQVAHKGRTWFELTVDGVTAHASTPWKGADAVAAMAEIICQIRRSIEACPEHPDLGRSTVTFGQITGGYRPYVVPDHCKVWIDMRLTPPIDTRKAVQMVEKAVEKASQAVPGTHGRYVITGDRPYVEKDDRSPLLRALKRAVRRGTGKEAVVGAFNGYTDTAVIAGTLGNHNCMSYGPGSLEMAHKPNEYVPWEDVKRCQAVLEALLEEQAFE